MTEHQTRPELPSLAGPSHPGSMETLKHMIFNLQSLDMSDSGEKSTQNQQVQLFYSCYLLYSFYWKYSQALKMENVPFN